MYSTYWVFLKNISERANWFFVVWKEFKVIFTSNQRKLTPGGIWASTPSWKPNSRKRWRTEMLVGTVFPALHVSRAMYGAELHLHPVTMRLWELVLHFHWDGTSRPQKGAENTPTWTCTVHLHRVTVCWENEGKMRSRDSQITTQKVLQTTENPSWCQQPTQSQLEWEMTISKCKHQGYSHVGIIWKGFLKQPS